MIFPDSKVGRISLQRLKCRLIFHITRKRMSESFVEIIQKALDLKLIWTRDLRSL